MSSKCFEYLTTQAIVTSILVDWPNSRKTRRLRQPEGARICILLQRLSALDTDAQLIIAGRAHRIVPATAAGGSSWVERPDGGCHGRLMLSAVDDGDRRVYVGFKLIRERGGKSGRLTLTFDPTAMLTGADVHPTLANEETGAMTPFPSSAPKVMQEMFRLGLSILESLQGLLTNSKSALFDSETKKAIRDDDFQIARVQWGADLMTPDPDRVLQLLTIMYGVWLSGDASAIQLATYLGLTLKIDPDAKTNEITAVTMRKTHGAKTLYTLKFSHGHGREAPPAAETTPPSRRLRMEITVHPDGIAQIVSKACERLRKFDDNVLGAKKEAFLAGDPASTLWWLERAIYVLSHSASEEEPVRASFADWLVPYMLHDVLGLHVIAGFAAEDLAKLGALDDNVARAWRAVPYSAETNWAEAIAEKAGCDPQTVYNRRKKWLDAFRVDIKLPPDFYSGLRTLGPISLTKPEVRSALTAAISHGDATKVLEVIKSALTDFDGQRREIVGCAIEAPFCQFAVEMVKTPTTSAAIGTRKASRRAAALPAPARGTARPPAATGARQKGQRPRAAMPKANRTLEIKTAKRTANGAKRPSAGRGQARGLAARTRRTRRQGGHKR